MNDVLSFSSFGLQFTKDKFYSKYDNAVPANILSILEPSSKSLDKIVDYAKTRGDQLFTKFDGSDEPPTDPLR